MRVSQPWLGQRLRMRGNRLDAVHLARLRHQAMADHQGALAQDAQGRVQQQVQAAVDRAFGGVLDRHHADVGLPRLDGAEDLVERHARQLLHRVAEMLQRGLLGKRALRPQVGDGHAALQATAGRDDLGPDRGHAGRRKRAGVELLQPADDLGFALGAQHRTVGMGGMLGLAHFLRGAGALRKKIQDLRIDGVDAVAQGAQLALQVIIHSGARIPSGTRPARPRRPAAPRCRSRRACRPRSCGP